MQNARPGLLLFFMWGLTAAASAQGPGDQSWYGVVQNDAAGPEWAKKAADLGVGSIKVRLLDTQVSDPDLIHPGQTIAIPAAR
ncbi:MAG: hypothetical protein HY720_05050 [Planctomycetes bacterium]|nr:hypothetical protein [Planctomycetota bacterium]